MSDLKCLNCDQSKQIFLSDFLGIVFKADIHFSSIFLFDNLLITSGIIFLLVCLLFIAFLKSVYSIMCPSLRKAVQVRYCFHFLFPVELACPKQQVGNRFLQASGAVSLPCLILSVSFGWSPYSSCWCGLFSNSQLFGMNVLTSAVVDLRVISVSSC